MTINEICCNWPRSFPVRIMIWRCSPNQSFLFSSFCTLMIFGEYWHHCETQPEAISAHFFSALELAPFFRGCFFSGEERLAREPVDSDSIPALVSFSKKSYSCCTVGSLRIVFWLKPFLARGGHCFRVVRQFVFASFCTLCKTSRHATPHAILAQAISVQTSVQWRQVVVFSSF